MVPNRAKFQNKFGFSTNVMCELMGCTSKKRPHLTAEKLKQEHKLHESQVRVRKPSNWSSEVLPATHAQL